MLMYLAPLNLNADPQEIETDIELDCTTVAVTTNCLTIQAIQLNEMHIIQI